MELTRIYDAKDLERYRREREQANTAWQARLAEQGVPENLTGSFAKQICDQVIVPPALAGVDIVHTGVQAEQHFSTTLITEFVRLGIVGIKGKQLTLHTVTENLHYTIRREPGRWCLHCGEKLADDTSGEMARLHMALKHKGVQSPDENNPSGYEWLTYFECVLDEDQHRQYRKGASNG